MAIQVVVISSRAVLVGSSEQDGGGFVAAAVAAADRAVVTFSRAAPACGAAWRQPVAASRTVDRLEVATVPVAGSVAAFECQEWAAMSRRRRWRAAECCSASVFIMVEKLGQSPAISEHDGRVQRHGRVGDSWHARIGHPEQKINALMVRSGRDGHRSRRYLRGHSALRHGRGGAPGDAAGLVDWRLQHRRCNGLTQ